MPVSRSIFALLGQLERRYDNLGSPECMEQVARRRHVPDRARTRSVKSELMTRNQGSSGSSEGAARPGARSARRQVQAKRGGSGSPGSARTGQDGARHPLGLSCGEERAHRVAVEHNPVKIEGLAQVAEEAGAMLGTAGMQIDPPGAAGTGQNPVRTPRCGRRGVQMTSIHDHEPEPIGCTSRCGGASRGAPAASVRR